MTYADYCLQFEQIDYFSKKETPGLERHHLTPRAVQIEKYGRVIDDTCILVTKEQHIEAHRLLNLEFPLCESQEIAYWFMTRDGVGMLGKTFTEDHKRKISKSQRGKHHSEETRKKLSEAKKGKHRSEETKKKISEAHKGKPHPHSEESRRKISEAKKGKPCSEETKKKISETLKGKPSGMKGRHHSEETKRKMSEAKKSKLKSEETRRRMSEVKRLKSQGYREYKSQGGELKWQEWCKQTL